MGEGKDLTDKGPGDAPDIKNIPKWRGEDGKGGHTTSEEKETPSVNYDK